VLYDDVNESCALIGNHFEALISFLEFSEVEDVSIEGDETRREEDEIVVYLKEDDDENA